MSLKSPWNLGRFLLLQLLALGLTGLTMILGAAPLSVARKFYSGRLYWGFGLATSLGLFVAGVAELSFGFFSLVLLAGIYYELESHQLGWKRSSAFAVGISSFALYCIFAVWTSVQNINWSERLEAEMAKIGNAETQAALDKIPFDTVLAQVPSIIVVLLLIAMAFSLLWEKRLISLFDDTADSVSERVDRLSRFALPDQMVWLLIPTLLFTTVYFDIKVLQTTALNVMNVLIVLYLFQGLAIVHRFFSAFNVGTIWRVLFYFLIIIQLHSILLISVLGVIDLWVDFRGRIDKKLQSDRSSE